jgi:hypothetical protein
MRHRPIFIVLAMTAIAQTATSQLQPIPRLSLDIRGNLGVPMSELSDTDLGTGIGLGAVAAVRLHPYVAAYGGWDWLHFGTSTSFAGTDRDFEETGYTLGLRFDHPVPFERGIRFRVETGAMYKHVEIEGSDGSLVGDSGHRLGFEGGAGFTLGWSSKLSLIAMSRYRSLDPRFTIGSATTTGSLRYVGLEVGLSLNR